MHSDKQRSGARQQSLWTSIFLAVLMTVAHSRANGKVDLRTPHYDLYLEGWHDDEVGAILEQAYEAMTRFFGAEPRERLQVKILSSQDRYRAALAADGLLEDRNRDASGTYALKNRTVYMWVQRNPEVARSTLLHECAHQFHYLTCTGNTRPRSSWYVEGVAEYFAMHRWDGKALEIAKNPDIGARDWPALALRNFAEKRGANLRAIAGSTDPVLPDQYAVAWSLITFLRQEDEFLFRQWRRLLDKGEEPKQAWDLTFDKKGSRLNSKYIEWLERQQRPWDRVFGTWQRIGPLIEAKARAERLAVAVQKHAKQELTATAELRDQQTSAGVVVAFRSDDDYMVVMADSNGSVAVDTIRDGKVVLTHWKGFQKEVMEKKSFNISATATKTGWVVTVNGVEIATIPEPGGKVGLVAHNGTVWFRDVTSK